MQNNRRPIIAGNWKMNGLYKDATGLARNLANRCATKSPMTYDMIIFPPFTILSSIIQLTKDSGIYVGAQDCHHQVEGAHTGDISPRMLTDIGCSHVIIGHSERRIKHNETDELINKKIQTAWSEELITVICVGETQEERNQGNAAQIIRSQIAGSIPNDANAINTIIAYEPVWAIGTGQSATPHEAQKMHSVIRMQLKESFSQDGDSIRILYGGSMNPENASDLISLEDVDGGLIGGASLDADKFCSIGALYER